MAFAPHTNTDCQNQRREGIRDLPLLLGQFRDCDTNVLFEYTERRHPDDSFAPEYQHQIYLIDGSTRLAKVLKTVAYIVNAETDHGLPIVDKWRIKQHAQYLTDWVEGEI